MKYFGTDGIRVKMDSSLNSSLFIKIGEYFSSLKGKRKILLACDTRTNCPYLKSLLLNGLLKKCDVVDLGVTSTPCLSYLMSYLDFDFGIMVSASHNPPIYNGIKILDNKGLKININRQKAIEKYIDNNNDLNIYNGTYVHKPGLVKVYEEFLVRSFYIDNDLRIAFDCSNGATAKIVKDVLPYFSFVGDVYFDNGIINYNCGATNLKSLKDIVKEKKYDLGVAFDGDGDRIQLIYKDRVIDGDDLLIYFSKKLSKNCVVTKITRRDTVEELQKLKRKIKKVNVGDSNIASYIKNNPSFIGGETSGHIILSRKHLTGDGLFICLMLLSYIKNKKDLENAFINKKYMYKSLSYKKHEKMNEQYLISLKKKYLNITNDKYTSFRYSGTEDILRVIIEGKTKKEINDKKRVIDSLIY